MKIMNEKRANSLTIALFVIYLITLFWIVLFKLGVHFSYMKSNRSINLIPYSQPVILNGKPDLGEIILNVLIFVPLGLYAGILFKKWSIRKKLLLFFSISLFIEVYQFVFGVGASDITDIINNTLGGAIGLMIYKGIEKIFGNSFKAQKFINIVSTIGTTLIIFLILYLKINRLLMFRR